MEDSKITQMQIAAKQPDVMRALELLDECRSMLSIEPQDFIDGATEKVCADSSKLSELVDVFLEEVGYAALIVEHQETNV